MRTLLVHPLCCRRLSLICNPMPKEFLSVHITLPLEQQEMAIAFLDQLGFDSFEQDGDQLRAWINPDLYNEVELREVISEHFPAAAHSILSQIEADKDWNAEWEANFQGVYIDDYCQVIPQFKEPESGFAHTIIIQPKMAFGTGHHNTTRMMVKFTQNIDFQGKRVLDMGCGTAILGILASKLGAESVLGIDIEEWAVENAKENIALNGVKNMEVTHGDSTSIPEQPFDVIFANIHRNVLISDSRIYRSRLSKNGHLALSGFFDFDRAEILENYEGLGMVLANEIEDDNWIALLLSNGN